MKEGKNNFSLNCQCLVLGNRS